MQCFTSITANYLPKARVLAWSIKRLHPDAVFHLVLSDSRDQISADDLATFDSVLGLDDLPIPDKRAWAFKHSVVELCTGVKAFAIQEIFRRFSPESVFYFDPDIAVLAPLDELSAH